jgi:cbb3-type cytochrome oxidase maturation protein
MQVILFILLASLSVALVFLIAFIWSVKSGQLDDVSTPSIRMLHDNETSSSTQTGKTKSI